MPGRIRYTDDLSGLPDGHMVSFPLAVITTRTGIVTVSVGQLRGLLADDGYTEDEGSVSLFGVDAIYEHLRGALAAIETGVDDELTLNE